MSTCYQQESPCTRHFAQNVARMSHFHANVHSRGKGSGSLFGEGSGVFPCMSLLRNPHPREPSGYRSSTLNPEPFLETLIVLETRTFLETRLNPRGQGRTRLAYSLGYSLTTYAISDTDSRRNNSSATTASVSGLVHHYASVSGLEQDLLGSVVQVQACVWREECFCWQGPFWRQASFWPEVKSLGFRV